MLNLRAQEVPRVMASKKSGGKVGKSRRVQVASRSAKTGAFVVPAASGTSAFNYYAHHGVARAAASARFRATTVVESTKNKRKIG